MGGLSHPNPPPSRGISPIDAPAPLAAGVGWQCRSTTPGPGGLPGALPLPTPLWGMCQLLCLSFPPSRQLGASPASHVCTRVQTRPRPGPSTCTLGALNYLGDGGSLAVLPAHQTPSNSAAFQGAHGLQALVGARAPPSTGAPAEKRPALSGDLGCLACCQLVTHCSLAKDAAYGCKPQWPPSPQPAPPHPPSRKEAFKGAPPHHLPGPSLSQLGGNNK